MENIKNLSVLLIISALLFSVSGLPATKAAAERKIVVFNENVSDSEKDQVLSKFADRKIKRLSGANADVLENINPNEAAKILQNPKIKRVDPDVVVQIQAQTLPWGVDRIEADLVWPTGNYANYVKVGVIDTGISSSHPDLIGNIKGGVNTINPRKSWNDDNGHGSHVAGIIGALNNTIGVVGAAPEVDLYAIKVLGASGSGYLSDIIEGIDWAIARNLQIINMSLGTSVDVLSMHEAVVRARNAGITQIAAAGNSEGAVIYPAAYPEVIAVAATDSGNNIASFSSRGPEVDLAAPGVSIYSTYKGKNYATLSGTSMAAPHVTGAAALVMNTLIASSTDVNVNGKWDPEEVQNKLQSTATDLGSEGWDSISGWGLVNAYLGVQ